MALKNVLEIFQDLCFKVVILVVNKFLNIFLWEQIEKEYLGFAVIKLFFVMTVQELDHMQCFLKAGEERLRGHGHVFFFPLCM